MDGTELMNTKSWFVSLLLACLASASAGNASSQTVEYIHTDSLGTPVVVTDAAKSVIERRDYLPYGDSLNQTNSDSPGYVGHVQDSATGLSYMQQRYFDSALGRFISTDPDVVDQVRAGNFSRYAYANNNPYTNVDLDGRETGTAFKVINEATNGGEIKSPPPSDKDWLGPAIGVGLGLALAPVAVYGGAEVALSAAANPVTATNIVNGLFEAAAGTSIAAGPGKQVFQNLAPADEIMPSMAFAASQIQKTSYSGRLNYVVTEAGKLVIGREGHISLARGAGVTAAGEARFVNGAIRSLNNASGHYRPAGDSARQAAEGAFNNAGFNASGTYVEGGF